MTPPVYTAITFAPVQGFIEKSRKLKDLYGSSFILSYLSDRLCRAAQQHLRGTERLTWPDDPVISPALIDVTQGVPNQILIKGEFPYEVAQNTFSAAWTDIVETCRLWIEKTVPLQPNGDRWEYEYWQRSWQAWTNHAWEFFWATGATGDLAKAALNDRKYARSWVGINWTGESSSLSGTDSRAWPHMGKHRPYSRAQAEEDEEVDNFYRQLSARLGEATITPREFLSIPEIVKRFITIRDVVNSRSDIEVPLSFKALNRLLNRADDTGASASDDIANDDAKREEEKRWTGWFQGDGDRAGDYLSQKQDEGLHTFSHDMRVWGVELKGHLPQQKFANITPARIDQDGDKDGRIIYAGGDDFLGVLYRNSPYPEMTPLECLQWFEHFKSTVWEHTGHPITVSVGFVWAAPNVPQRDVLQHCREAEKAAKKAGRDRIAFRILFNSGNYLEWVCPWWLLEGEPHSPGLLAAYRDRQGIQGHDRAPNWTHIYTDIAALESRHAFQPPAIPNPTPQNITVALSLIEVYFGTAYRQLFEQQETWWNQDDPDTKLRKFSGILGDRNAYTVKDRKKPNYGEADIPRIEQAFNEWVINLAKVGFHMTQPLTALQPAA